MGWQDAPIVSDQGPTPAWQSAPEVQDGASQGGLPVITDDGTNWNAPPPGPSQPGLLSRMGNAIAHPVQAVEDAWNYPGSYWGNAAGAAKDAASIPGDVANNKQPLDASIIPRLTSAAMMVNTPGAGSEAVGFGAKSVSAPTDALLSAGSQGFNDWRASPLRYDPHQFANWAQQQKQGLIENGPSARSAPDLHEIIDGMSNPPPGALDATPREVQNWRQEFSDLARSNVATNPVQSTAADRLKRSFSEFLANAPPTNAVDGALTPEMQSSVQGYKDANANYAAGKQASFVDNLGENADLQNASAHSGHAGGNPIRQNVKSALRVNPVTGINQADRAGLSDAAQDVLGQVPAPVGPWANRIRTTSNLAGGGLGHAGLIGALIAAREGYEAGGIPGAAAGAALPFVGVGLRGADESLTRGRLNNASNFIRSSAPLSQTGGYTIPRIQVGPETQGRLARALLMQQQQGQPQQP